MGAFDLPIPGMSLTKEPGNAPYERPPQIVDPEEALMAHLERLNDADTMESALMMLERGMDVKSLAEAVLRNAVSRGVHTIDVSLIIQKPVEEWISGVATEVGIDYKTGYEKADRKPMRERHAALKSGEGLTEQSFDVLPSVEEPMAEQPQETQQELPLEMPEQEPAPQASKGLMARG